MEHQAAKINLLIQNACARWCNGLAGDGSPAATEQFKVRVRAEIQIGTSETLLDITRSGFKHHTAPGGQGLDPWGVEGGGLSVTAV